MYKVKKESKSRRIKLQEEWHVFIESLYKSFFIWGFNTTVLARVTHTVVDHCGSGQYGFSLPVKI